MNSKKRSGIYLRARLCITVILMFALNSLKSQPASHTPRFSPVIDDNINGFWEYLPRDYSTEVEKSYPLLIFFHGYADSGSSPDSATLRKVLNAGTPYLINTGNFPDSFNIDNNWHKFVVISPQIKVGFSGDAKTSNVLPSTIDALINYATSAYRINDRRIYLCGLSMGGGIASSYAGSSTAAANRLAAIAIAAGAAELDTLQTDNIAASYIAVLATHNTIDDVVPVDRTTGNIARIVESKRKLRALNLPNPPVVDPDPVSYYWGISSLNNNHNSWTRTFEEVHTGVYPGGVLTDTIGINVYQWMLRYGRVETALPLEWRSFNVYEAGKNIEIEWSTSREVNVKNFIVEKSPNGSLWTALTSVLPAAVNDPVKSYRFTDTKPVGGIHFYRIKQVDLDGKFTYSAVKRIAINQPNTASAKVYPNPFHNEFTLSLPAGVENNTIHVRLVDSHGAIVRSENYSSQPGNSTLTIKNLQGLSKGIYFISIENAKGSVLAREKLFKR
ncbi:MAG TPA: T9SS type A sorting domain-containing protein [Chitinophagaceae bacterium]|nr:T9SS type A sorting domain-containing protein [Chitinophagaceae bacterium]